MIKITKTFLIVGTALFMTACSCGNKLNSNANNANGNAVEGASVNTNFAGSSFPNKVYFAFDKSNISDEAAEIVKVQSSMIPSGKAVTVEGHCDERGTVEYNLGLGERRANAVKNTLVANGVSPSAITTISYGKSNPLVSGHTPEAYAQNRVAVTSIND
jgi:peptidoglycan-associated lipoprotein